MQPRRDPAIIERMKLTFELFSASEAIMRQNFRRRLPAATDAEIEQRLLEWLRSRPEDRVATAR